MNFTVISKSGTCVIQEGSAHTRTWNLKALEDLAQNLAKLTNMWSAIEVKQHMLAEEVPNKNQTSSLRKDLSNLLHQPIQKSIKMRSAKKFPDKSPSFFVKLYPTISNQIKRSSKAQFAARDSLIRTKSPT